ncbi:MAG: hypothetical protein RL033_4901 [Pseudomonadota bacterium]|jgi:hypothetical protein
MTLPVIAADLGQERARLPSRRSTAARLQCSPNEAPLLAERGSVGGGDRHLLRIERHRDSPWAWHTSLF